EGIKDEWCIDLTPTRLAEVVQARTRSKRSPSSVRSVATPPEVLGQDVNSRACDLHGWLINCFERREPTLLTYKTAYQYLFQAAPDRWLPPHTKSVVKLAENTPGRPISGLGVIRLDGSVVAEATGCPGRGHWDGAPYDEEEWGRAFFGARVIC